MYDYEILAKDPNAPLILWLGFGLIGLWGLISLFVFITPRKPKSWIVKKLYSHGKNYSENKNLKTLYISYSAISFACSLLPGGRNEIFIFFSEIILVLNVVIIAMIHLVMKK